MHRLIICYAQRNLAVYIEGKRHDISDKVPASVWSTKDEIRIREYAARQAVGYISKITGLPEKHIRVRS